MNNLFETGVERYSVEDDRIDVLGDGKSRRRIEVIVYYPIAGKGENESAYLSERKALAVSKAFLIPKKAIMKQKVPVYEGMSMAEGKFPLLMFSHGYNSFAESNTYLFRDIAARGYVVASIGHPYEAVACEFEDGSVIYYDKSINRRMYMRGPLSAIRALNRLLKDKGDAGEVSKKFDKFQREHTPYLIDRIPEWKKDTYRALESIKDRYSEHLDLTNGVAVSGHSFGGATAYALCHDEGEFTVGLNIDGGLFGEYGDSALKKPFYQFSCSQNINAESGVLINHEAPVYTAVFSRMQHIGFTDVKFFLKAAFMVGRLDSNIMYKHLLEGHLFMLEKYLKGLDVELNRSTDPSVVIEEHDKNIVFS